MPRKKDEKYNLANKRRGNSTGDYEDDDEEYENICNSQYQYARSHNTCTLTYVAKYNPSLSRALLLSLTIYYYILRDLRRGVGDIERRLPRLPLLVLVADSADVPLEARGGGEGDLPVAMIGFLFLVGNLLRAQYM